MQAANPPIENSKQTKSKAKPSKHATACHASSKQTQQARQTLAAKPQKQQTQRLGKAS